MKIHRLVINTIFVSLGCLAVEAQAGPAPLSCRMQMMLTGMTAMERDRGVTRKDATIANTPDPDLTPQEIKKILDRVYVKGKKETADQIANDVFTKCQNGQ